LLHSDTTNYAIRRDSYELIDDVITVKLGYSNIGFCDTLSIASNIQWYALIPHKAYSFITTLFLGPFDDVITKFYCISYVGLLRLQSSDTST
jgi:hypothetical protein